MSWRYGGEPGRGMVLCGIVCCVVVWCICLGRPRRGVVQYDVVWCGVFGGLPGGHMGVDKAPAEHIYTDNWCEDLGSLKY